jgi:hypothetical protein
MTLCRKVSDINNMSQNHAKGDKLGEEQRGRIYGLTIKIRVITGGPLQVPK